MIKIKFSMKAKKRRISKSFWRFLYLFILGLIIICIILIIIFISKSLITASKSSEEILILRKEIAPDAFNVNEFNQAIEKLDKKTDQSDTIDWSEVKNIFLESGSFQPVSSKPTVEQLNEVFPR
jgi:uncharacterized membrane protein YukC